MNEIMAMLSLIEITSGQELCAVLLVGKCCWAASSQCAPGVSPCAQPTSLARESSGGEVMWVFCFFGFFFERMLALGNCLCAEQSSG